MLPETDIAKWKSIPRLKCKVTEIEYRDYTLATWNTENKYVLCFLKQNIPAIEVSAIAAILFRNEHY